MLSNIYDVIEAITENVSPQVLQAFISNKLSEKQSRIKIEKKDISTISSSILSWRVAIEEELDRENKLIQYARLHPKEYEKKVQEINKLEKKTLSVDAEGHLIIVDAPETDVKKENARYVGRCTLEELIEHVLKNKEHIAMLRKGSVENVSLINQTSKE